MFCSHCDGTITIGNASRRVIRCVVALAVVVKDESHSQEDLRVDWFVSDDFFSMFCTEAVCRRKRFFFDVLSEKSVLMASSCFSVT